MSQVRIKPSVAVFDASRFQAGSGGCFEGMYCADRWADLLLIPFGKLQIGMTFYCYPMIANERSKDRSAVFS